ncbi:hypothetical protein [Rufibacter sp. XAAS-G3-1]|uniref:DUF7674 family protein n=1 Tax=Rufibacter sp. XAAS-G3-1 TaxID=2729134 RepID=UPI0015E66CF7|nr:hypothetical protein [Rufibacter sp. XAAS-G3-1]
MTNWEYYKKPNSIDKDKAIELITSSIPDLKKHWDIYKSKEYTDYSTERNDYIDIGEVARYVVVRAKSKKTDGFSSFFDSVEAVLANGDSDTINLVVVGLLEDIQNISSGEKDIDYHTDFDIWLRPKTKEAWEQIIQFWEGEQ